MTLTFHSLSDPISTACSWLPVSHIVHTPASEFFTLAASVFLSHSHGLTVHFSMSLLNVTFQENCSWPLSPILPIVSPCLFFFLNTHCHLIKCTVYLNVFLVSSPGRLLALGMMCVYFLPIFYLYFQYTFWVTKGFNEPLMDK